MNADVTRLLDRNGGLATTAQLLTVMTRQQLDVQVRKGGLFRVWYGVYSRVEPDLLGRPAAPDVFMGQPAVASMTPLCGRGGALRASWNGRFVISAADAALPRCAGCCRSRMHVRSRRWRAKPGL